MHSTRVTARCGFSLAFSAFLGASSVGATPTSFAEFAIYGTNRVDLESHDVVGGPIGSADDLSVTESDVESIYGVGNVTIGDGGGSFGDTNGDVIAVGTVEITQGNHVFGSVHSSAPAGSLGGAEVLGPANSIITGDVVALGDVTFGNGMELGGSVRSDGDLAVLLNGDITGDARANGAIALGLNVGIGGDVVYGTTLSGEATATIGGTPSQSTATLVVPETFTAMALPAPAIFAAGVGVLGTNDAGSSLANPLAPGSYGSLESKNIYLTGGTYVFSAIEITKNADLYLDLSGDPIQIFVEGDVLFDGTSRSLDVFVSADGVNSVDYDVADPSLASNVWLETHGTFRTDKKVQWFGSIFAPHEGIQAELMSVVGALYAGGHIDGDVGLPGIELLAGSIPQNHVYVAPSYTNTPIPEAGTGALLVVGLVGLALRRRQS